MTTTSPRLSRLAATLAALLAAATVHADEVTSKGTVLRGKITGVTSSGVTMETEYGKGEIAIKWEDVQDLKSDANFQVLYGDGETATAPLRGLEDGKLLVGSDAPVDTKTVVAGNPIGDGLGWRDRMRDYWRYWDGSLDAGFNLQEATTDTLGFYTGFTTIRTKKPTRFTLAANYRYSTQQPKGEDKSTIEDRAFGLVRGDYDLTERFYVFASGDATYDAIQELSIRGVPKLGVGYVLWQEQLDEARRNFVAVEAGGAWVYENYFKPIYPGGPEDQNFFAVAFGAAAAYYLPYGAVFTSRLDYLPAIDDFTGDYLLRGEAALVLPVVDPLAVKLGVLDEYDSTPAEGTDNNSFYFTSALSLLW
jgi:hypothetical protein